MDEKGPAGIRAISDGALAGVTGGVVRVACGHAYVLRASGEADRRLAYLCPSCGGPARPYQDWGTNWFYCCDACNRSWGDNDDELVPNIVSGGVWRALA